jgi:hypothetical protein
MEAADCDYRMALPAVLEEDPELKRAYALTEKARAGEQTKCSDDYESGG